MGPEKNGSVRGPQRHAEDVSRPRDIERQAVRPERALHPAAARLIREIRATGEFTDETWERLSRAMDDLSDADLSLVLEEIGMTARKKAGR
jgi:hypothetical protein